MADENYTPGELYRLISKLDDETVDKSGFEEWKTSQNEWREAHDERHSWLVRAIVIVAITVVVELLVRLLPLIADPGALPSP